MLATEVLKHEHEVIKRMLTVLEVAADRVDGGRDLPPNFLSKAVDFIRSFADRYHHGKEEDNLFPAMERRGIPKQGGPIGVMLMEHDQGREFVKGMDEAGQRLAAGDQSALRAAAENARGYATLLRNHIDKEDNILYTMADQALTLADQQELLGKFDGVERDRLGPGKHEEYLALVEKLEEELGVG